MSRKRKAPKTKKPRVKRKTQSEKIADMPIENIIKQWKSPGGEKKVRGYLRTLQLGYKRRVAMFKRKGLFSNAQEAYENRLPKGYKMPSPAKVSYHKLILEIARLQSFFRGVTSTEAGIKAVNRDQDIRIFGTDKRGTPLGEMTREERKAYWKLYNQFQDQESLASTFASNQIQFMLATMRSNEDFIELSHVMDEGYKGDLTVDSLTSFFNDLLGKLSLARDLENLEDIDDLYYGEDPFD